MARKANPALLGGFVLGAMALAVAGLVVFGGGKFFRSTQRWVAYFDEDIKGLAIGAPVMFRGVKVGSVTDIRVVVDPKTKQVRTPVFFELEADRMTNVEGGKLQFLPGAAGVKALIESGLRAQLQTQSFVTGQLNINLDFRRVAPRMLREEPASRESELKLAGELAKYPEFPSIPSAMAAFEKSLENINIQELTGDLKDMLQGITRLVNSAEVKQVLVTAVGTLEGVKKLAATADAKVASLEPALEKTTATINETLDTIQALVRHADSQTLTAVNETLTDAQHLVRRVDAETVPALNQVLADLRPLVADIDKAVGAASSALEQAQKTLATAEGAVEDGSPLQYQMRLTLQEVAAAARAFRVLSSYLERHPDAVLFGKGGK